MRTLFIISGAPGCGKSTFIAEKGLKPYTICPDDIRYLYGSPVMVSHLTKQDTDAGDYGFRKTMQYEKYVWKLVWEVLELRMQKGAFTVIDATNLRTSDISKYKKLAQKYRYRVYVIDFTNTPKETILERNLTRPHLQKLPDKDLNRMISRVSSFSIPSGVTRLLPEDYQQGFYSEPIDLSNYKKVHIIGDIHGSNTVLQEYLTGQGGFKEDEYYIFLGDYIDRGVENVDIIRFLLEIYDKPNVCLLEGNHERWLQIWAEGDTGRSQEFENVTRVQLDKAVTQGILEMKRIRQFYRKLRQCIYFSYTTKDDEVKKVLVTHGGLSTLPPNLTLVATEEMIKGTGDYKDMLEVDTSFLNSTPVNVYQVHGHRNIEKVPIQVNERCFNLCEEVEFGENLRCLQLTKEGFEEVYTQNKVFREKTLEEKTMEEMNMSEVIQSLRANKYINEKVFGPISSFNFANSAFYDKAWDNQTTKARGLYIDTQAGKVVARSYDKFFNINEMQETKIETLKKKLKFPIAGYVKENGYLGILSYNPYTDDILFTSKSSITGPFAEWFKALFLRSYSKTTYDRVKEYCKVNNKTMVFEVVDIENDPHIIDYLESNLTLLDIVDNSMIFNKLPYEELCEVGKSMGLTVKEKGIELNNWDEFISFYREINKPTYLYKDNEIEGFVFEDQNGFMVKTKLHYYSYWKNLRKVIEIINRVGKYNGKKELTDQQAVDFRDWLLERRNAGLVNNPHRLCELRNLFLSRKRI